MNTEHSHAPGSGQPPVPPVSDGPDEAPDDFELRLRRLAPARPAAAWMQEASALLNAAPASRPAPFPRLTIWLGASAAAAAVAFAMWQRNHQAIPGPVGPETGIVNTAPADTIVPVRLAHSRLPPVDEGVVINDGQVWRRIRQPAVDESWWAEGTGADAQLIRLTLPRDEFIYLPEETY